VPYVVVGGSGSYTDKFEVIGYVKANAFVVVALTGITKIVGLGNVDNTPASTKSVDTAFKWAGRIWWYFSYNHSNLFNVGY
jgi:hypothetical protein